MGIDFRTFFGGAASPAPLVIGDINQRGIIFYLDGSGNHGLISATTDQSTGANWGCYTTWINGTSTAI